jgi:pimeloyl-ACP methyl ester carboxylesterase/DNA-binding transcriptional MerR regulator
MTSGRRWRIGELAAATGLTVRTLHHYEHIGLLGPAARTEGRQRLYDAQDVQRLYRIRALRDLGLSLEDIGRMLEDDGAALGDVLRAHLARVDVELQRLGRLRMLLDHACAQTAPGEDPDAVLATIEAMSQVTRHIDAHRMDEHAAGEDEARWRALGDELRACMEAGDDPSAPRVRAVARAVEARLLEFSGGDRATLDALARLRRLAPPKNLAGWSPELFRYLDLALASLHSKGAHAMLTERIATNVGPSRLDLAYVQHGNPEHPTVLLVMGIAAQLVNWPLGFLQALVQRGLHVVCFDNRDSGRSTHMRDAPPADLPATLRGDLSSVSYTLSDMAADAVGLLDALKVDAAHLVGASMGGAIAQTVAIEHPKRVRSLTSMMFTTGDMAVGQVHPATMKSVFGGPPVRTREEYIARAVRNIEFVGSPAFPVDPAEVAERAGLAYDRDFDEAAVARQAVATVASGDRTPRLRELDVPALVLHGLADTLCDPSGGRATAAAIPGAELVLIEGMGHDLPPGLWDRIADHIATVVQRGEARAQPVVGRTTVGR